MGERRISLLLTDTRAVVVFFWGQKILSNNRKEKHTQHACQNVQGTTRTSVVSLHQQPVPWKLLVQELWPSLVLLCLQDLTRSQDASVAVGQQPGAPRRHMQMSAEGNMTTHVPSPAVTPARLQTPLLDNTEDNTAISHCSLARITTLTTAVTTLCELYTAHTLTNTNLRAVSMFRGSKD